MKGKINLKTIIIFAILILVIVLLVLGINVAKTFMSGASADYEPQNLTAVSKEDGKTATVSWTSNKEIKASIFYGTNMASLLLMAEDMEPTANHNILLTNLRSNMTYFYKIVVDSDNIFDNGGVMYNFKTGGVVEEVVPSVTLVPTVSLSACDKVTDYNKDGVVNSMDYISCSKGTVTPATEDKCAGDYNKDGVINSLDRLRCLQDSKI